MYLKKIQLKYNSIYIWYLFAVLLSTFASLYSIVVYSPFARPIWFDEFLQFAFLASDDIGEVWKVATTTNQDINHGQTNVLTLIQFILYKSGAPILWALRGPSIFATWAMFFGVLMCLKTVKSGPFWQIVTIALIALQSNLLIHSGEARPYIFLCAAISLTLAYYLNNPGLRSGIFLTSIGYLGVFIGCLFHPYFSLYWAAIFLSSYLGMVISKEDELSFQTFFRNINLPLLFFGSSIYFILGFLTWLVVPPVFEFDPFQYMGKNIIENVIKSNFEFLVSNINLFIALTIILILSYIFHRNKLFLFLKNNYTTTSILLITSSIVIPIILSYISYRAGYWILTRGWIGSFLLAPLGFMILVSQFFRKELNSRNLGLANSIAPVTLLIVIFHILIHRFYFAPDVAISHSISRIEINMLIDELPKKEINWVHMADIRYSSLERAEIQATADKYVLYANRNIALGGAINKSFRNFYCTVHSVRSNSKLFANCFNSDDDNFR
jgi:hypothetical protein